jgi:hypothetical protein
MEAIGGGAQAIAIDMEGIISAFSFMARARRTGTAFSVGHKRKQLMNK